MMTRHDDSQRSDRLAVRVGHLRVVDRLAASIASSPRLEFDGSMMKRHDDSQRSDRLAVTLGDPHESLTARRAYASLPRLGFSRMPMKRHDDSQRSHRLAVTQPILPPPPPLFRTEKQLTAPADRPVRDLAHAVAFTTAVAVGGAGSVHRRTGMRAARALLGDRNRPGTPPATDCRQNPPPASPVNHPRCFAGHRRAWRCDAGPDVRRAVGVCMMRRTRGSHLTSAIWQGTLCPKKEVKMILKEP